MSTTPHQESSKSAIVFFDGVCAMCNSSVNLIMRHDRSGQIQFAPLQGTTAIEKLGPVQASELKSIIMIDENGTWRKSTAICRILFRMGGIWKLLGACLWIIPYPLRDFGYSVIAKYRYRLFGKHESCRIPSADERLRFLD